MAGNYIVIEYMTCHMYCAHVDSCSLQNPYYRHSTARTFAVKHVVSFLVKLKADNSLHALSYTCVML